MKPRSLFGKQHLLPFSDGSSAIPYPKGKIVALDVETTGLNPYAGDRIFYWSYITELGEFGSMLKNELTLAWVKRLFDDQSKTVVFHHAKFDLKMFGFEGLDIFNSRATFDCTLIMSKLFNMNGNHDLRSLTIRYCPGRSIADKDEIVEWLRLSRKSFVKTHGRPPNFSDAPIEIVKRRCLWDVESTLLIHAAIKPKMLENCAELYETERQLMLACIEMENTGVRVDLTRAEELYDQALKDIQRIYAHLNRLVCPLIIQKKKKGELIEVEIDAFNPNSSAIHLPAAFTKLGIALKYRTKPKKGKKGGAKKGGGRWAFDEYAMIRYVSPALAEVIRTSGEEGWPAARFYSAIQRMFRAGKLSSPREWLPPLVLKYRELKKMMNTYYNHILENAVDIETTPDGRVYGILHCKFNQSEAMTGRFSSSDPNMQNMPRLLGPRECFVPRKGHRNWHFDYEQVEMKFFVHFARDRKMAKALEDDIHLHVASDIYGKPVGEITKEQRKRAKKINFGIIYGSGPSTIAETLTREGLPTSKPEAARLVANYHRAYPSVRRVTNELKVSLMRRGYIVNPFGRRYHIPTKFGYKGLNYDCQGTSADLLKRAMVAIWLWLRANNLRSKIIKCIHDELVLQIPRSEERMVVPKVVQLMTDLKTFFVPITVDVEVNDSRWSNKKNPEEIGAVWLASAVRE